MMPYPGPRGPRRSLSASKSSRAALVRSIVESLAEGFARPLASAAALSGRSVGVVHMVGGVKVALMVTCLNDALFPDAGRAVVTLLRRLGVEVDFPEQQACCGQPMVNAGYLDEAVPVVRNCVSAFEGYDAVVTPSGSCAGSVRHQHGIVARRAGDPALSAMVDRTYELSEFLVDVLGVTDVGAYFPHTVAYHPTCHSVRMLGVGDRPRRLLSKVRGLRLVELADSQECCGFGGTFAVKNSDTSVAMGSDKARTVVNSGAEVLVAGDSSCLMHIGGLLSRSRSGVRTMHLAEILASTEEVA
jgi:L-lactate dehydrogenase complex protein LldE